MQHKKDSWYKRVFRVWIEIPYIGFSCDESLFWHTGRDTVFSALAGLLASQFMDAPVCWRIGLAIGFGISLGWEGREKFPSYFDVGDFFVSIPGTQLTFNVALWLSDTWAPDIVLAVLGLQLVVYGIVVGGLLIINLIFLGRKWQPE